MMITTEKRMIVIAATTVSSRNLSRGTKCQFILFTLVFMELFCSSRVAASKAGVKLVLAGTAYYLRFFGRGFRKIFSKIRNNARICLKLCGDQIIELPRHMI